MVYIIFMLIKPFSEHLCPVDGALSSYGGIAKIMACPAFLYMTLSMIA